MRADDGWLRILRRPFDLLFANLRLLAGVAAVPLVGETIVVLSLFALVQSAAASMDPGNRPVNYASGLELYERVASFYAEDGSLTINDGMP